MRLVVARARAIGAWQARDRGTPVGAHAVRLLDIGRPERVFVTCLPNARKFTDMCGELAVQMDTPTVKPACASETPGSASHWCASSSRRRWQRDGPTAPDRDEGSEFTVYLPTES